MVNFWIIALSPTGTENPAEDDDRIKVAVDKAGGSYCITQRWIHKFDVIQGAKGKKSTDIKLIRYSYYNYESRRLGIKFPIVIAQPWRYWDAYNIIALRIKGVKIIFWNYFDKDVLMLFCRPHPRELGWSIESWLCGAVTEEPISSRCSHGGHQHRWAEEAVRDGPPFAALRHRVWREWSLLHRLCCISGKFWVHAGPDGWLWQGLPLWWHHEGDWVRLWQLLVLSKSGETQELLVTLSSKLS